MPRKLPQVLGLDLNRSERRVRRGAAPAADATSIATNHALFGRIGERAKMPFPVHPHMLRHGCGYALANAGHDTRALQAWLGYSGNIA
jgi:integrase